MKEIYNEAYAIFHEFEEFSKKSAICLLAMGYNGYKRIHRYNSRCFLDYQLKLACNLFDKYSEKIEIKSNPVINHDATNLKEHFIHWDAQLEKSIGRLGELNKKHFEMAGVENCEIIKGLNLLVNNHGKLKRDYRRFSESGWSPHDMHNVDDKRHEKYKHKEEDQGYKGE